MNQNKKTITSSVDPVDHENKVIRKAEDYVEHDQDKLVDREENSSDTMMDESKQVSAEIARSNEVDDLQDMGC